MTSPDGPAACPRVGDWLLRFGADGPAPAARGGASWTATLRSGDAELLISEPVAGAWAGFPALELATERWRFWLLGELYPLASDPRIRLRELAAGGTLEAIAELNGHFLLLGLEAESDRWHLWTDRFGTVHAYLGPDAVGTCFRAVAAGSRRRLDPIGLHGFLRSGYFLGGRTHLDDVSALGPARHLVVGPGGDRLREERVWSWERVAPFRGGLLDAVDLFGSRLRVVAADLTGDGRVALPISGGLDSRCTVAALAGLEGRELWPYSYGWGDDSVELRIAGEVAVAAGLPLATHRIGPYLFDRLETVLDATEGFVDLTQPRQAAVAAQLGGHADAVLAAHWGDVWMDTVLPPETDELSLGEALLAKLTRRGSGWLLDYVQGMRMAEDGFREEFDASVAPYAGLPDRQLAARAYKTDQWSVRWTLASLRTYQLACYPRLPFYDLRLADPVAGMPAEYVHGRRIQLEYLRRHAPDLARIVWQGTGTDLLHLRHWRLRTLPVRLLRRARRGLTGRPPIERNWEVQLAGERGREGLERWLTRPGLRLHELVAQRDAAGLVERLRSRRDPADGYRVSMLLTLSAWLELHG